MKSGAMISLYESPMFNFFHGISFRLNLNCIPNERIANGIIQAPKNVNASKVNPEINCLGTKRANIKMRNGGNLISRRRMDFQLKPFEEKDVAIKIPKVDNSKKLPG